MSQHCYVIKTYVYIESLHIKLPKIITWHKALFLMSLSGFFRQPPHIFHMSFLFYIYSIILFACTRVFAPCIYHIYLYIVTLPSRAPTSLWARSPTLPALQSKHLPNIIYVKLIISHMYLNHVFISYIYMIPIHIAPSMLSYFNTLFPL